MVYTRLGGMYIELDKEPSYSRDVPDTCKHIAFVHIRGNKIWNISSEALARLHASPTITESSRVPEWQIQPHTWNPHFSYILVYGSLNGHGLTIQIRRAWSPYGKEEEDEDEDGHLIGNTPYIEIMTIGKIITAPDRGILELHKIYALASAH